MEKMKKDIKIFVSHRIDLDSETIDNPLFIPVRCGAVYDKRENVTMLGDNTGDNISEKRNSFCELTVQYWAWKNVKADYYGLCHYRRYFSFSDKKENNVNIYNHIEEDIITEKFLNKYEINYEKISKLLDDFDILKIEPMVLNESVYKSIIKNTRAYTKDGVDLFLSILKKQFPELTNYADTYMNGKIWQAWNCYILPKKIFFDYSEKLFKVLFELDKKLDVDEYNIEQQRMVGYMGEIMFPIYVNYLIDKENVKFKNLQLVEIKNTSKINEIEPLNEKSINVAITSSNEYVPFLSTLIESIKINSENIREYDIVILENKISSYNKEILIKQLEQNPNIHIRFVDISRYLNKYKLYTRDHVTAMTYAGLSILDIFKNYRKLIYLDCDIVVNYNLAELFDVNIEEYFFGAVRDSIMAGWVNSQPFYVDHVKKLGIKKKNDYFNAGVLLINIDLLKQYYTSKMLFEIAASDKWLWFDQDILNKISIGKVKFLSQKWNVMSHVHTDLYDLPEYYASAKLYEQYVIAQKEPFIIHYAGRCIPCFHPETDLAEFFWKYARLSPYYELILYKMAIDTSSRVYYFSQKNYPQKVLNKLKNIVKQYCPIGSRRYFIAKEIYTKFFK